MALINRTGQVVEDGWSYSDVDGNLAVEAWSVVPLDALTAMAPGTHLDRPIGAYVRAGATADLVVPLLERLDLVVVEFPKFRDGRGFTVARALRERHGFKGDIRAVGHVLPDQFAALVRCGFSSIVTPSDHPPEQWRKNAFPPSAEMSGGPLLQRLMGRRAVAGVNIQAPPVGDVK